MYPSPLIRICLIVSKLWLKNQTMSIAENHAWLLFLFIQSGNIKNRGGSSGMKMCRIAAQCECEEKDLF